MKKVALILVMSMAFSILAYTKEDELTVKAADLTTTTTESIGKTADLTTTTTEPIDKTVDLSTTKAAKSKENIVITAEDLNVRQEKSTDSQIVSEARCGEIYEVLASGKDEQGKVWYKINAELGVTGWVAGWYCKKTKENINTAIESKPGKLLNACTKEPLYIKLLLMEDYSLSKVLKLCGSKYTKNTDHFYNTYEYQDGTKVEINNNKEVYKIEVGGRSIYVNQIQKLKGDLLNNIGNEIIIFTGESLIFVEAKSKKVIREYNTGELYIDDFKLDNYVGDGKLDLYISGDNSSGDMQNIYEISNNTLVRRYAINSFGEYSKGIDAKINKSKLTLAINIGNYKASETSELPERVFYDTKKVKDKNDLLSIDPTWTLVQVNGTWNIKLHINVNLAMINYYWGPPGDSIEDNETMYNDLARIDILLDAHSKTPDMKEITHAIKYNDPTLNQVKPIAYEEGLIVDGPELGTSMLEACKSLGGKLPKDYGGDQQLIVNGVKMSDFCSQVVNILVETPEYKTTRGLKVGDDIQTVERLYGKPDVGFSGDPMVTYKFCYKDRNGDMYLNYYRTLNIYYKDGLVSAYEFDQVILD